MTLMVNAWLERIEPRIELIEVNSGRIELEIPTKVISVLLQMGELMPSDFLQPVDDLIRQLLCSLDGRDNVVERRLRSQMRLLLVRLLPVRCKNNVYIFPAVIS